MKDKDFFEWIDTFHKFGVKLGLERIKYICEKLGNPQNNYKTIHVGGTNGKGSVCKLLGSILKESKYKVGIYTSPHLERFSERIVVDGKEISEKDLSLIFQKIKPIVDEMQEKNMNPTYFEIVTAISFLYFSIKKVDISVIEVGLGGRFDATNIIKPCLSVICNISMEHQDRLGNTIEKISLEKAGIIKENIPVVTAATSSALKVIKKIASDKKSNVFVVSKDNWERINFDNKKQVFKIKNLNQEYLVKTKLLGKFQGENIALSLVCINFLQNNGFKIDREAIEKGLLNVKNPGRMEVISTKPIILLDGAHNIEGIKKLRKALEEDFSYYRLILVIGILEDKKYIEMLEIIVPVCDKIVVTKSKNKRSCNPFSLKKEIEYINYKKQVIAIENLDKAVLYAKQEAGIRDMICICGSLFTVGEARNFLKELILF